MFPREKLREHLEHCPASVIFCTMEWNRYPVYSKSRLSWVPFFQPNPVLVKGHLDVELAFRDQRVLSEVFRRRFKKGKTKVDLMRRTGSAITNTTLSTHGNGLPQSSKESGKVAMALALASLENKLRKQRSVEETLVEEDCDDFSVTAKESREESSRLSIDLGLQQEIECEVDFIDDHCSGTEIELHSLQVDDGENLSGEERATLQDNPSENIPCPPEHVPVYLNQPLGLNVVVETLPKFQKQFPMYSIPCNQVFRRDEYSGHFKNVHSDIQGGLNGWLEHRCPLAQYGCTYVRYRLLPHSQRGAVIFNQELGSFGVMPSAGVTAVSTSHSADQSTGLSPAHTNVDLLTSLPLEILEKIAGHLDGFSLCNFSRTCKLVREVCRNALETKGMVLFEWEKRIYDNGGWSWKIRQKVWLIEFFNPFTPDSAKFKIDKFSKITH